MLVKTGQRVSVGCLGAKSTPKVTRSQVSKVQRGHSDSEIHVMDKSMSVNRENYINLKLKLISFPYTI